MSLFVKQKKETVCILQEQLPAHGYVHGQSTLGFRTSGTLSEKGQNPSIANPRKRLVCRGGALITAYSGSRLSFCGRVCAAEGENTPGEMTEISFSPLPGRVRINKERIFKAGIRLP